MILVVGSTSRVGVRVIPRLLKSGKAIRGMTRNPASLAARNLQSLGAQIVGGDLRDRASLEAACRGAQEVLSLATGFSGKGGENPKTVDAEGTCRLIDVSRSAGVSHFVFVSVVGAGPHNSLDLSRAKWSVEEHLKTSGLSYTILRCSFFMEAWGALIGDPILRGGKATIFGRGDNPVSLVSANDVAQYAEIALTDSRARGRTLEVVGTERLSLNQIADVFQKVKGGKVRVSHVPRLILRLLHIMSQPINPSFSQLILAALLMDTEKQTYDMTETLALFPVRLTPFEDVATLMAAAKGSASKVEDVP
jgi:uncharacterized protein YbjT (DUF2867 family)